MPNFDWAVSAHGKLHDKTRGIDSRGRSCGYGSCLFSNDAIIRPLSPHYGFDDISAANGERAIFDVVHKSVGGVTHEVKNRR